MSWLKRLLFRGVTVTPVTVKQGRKLIQAGDVIAVRGEWAVVMAIGDGRISFRFEDDRCNVLHTMAS